MKDEFPDAKILTVDSLCASLGQGLFVYLCAQEQKKGKTIDEVKTFAEETKGRVCHWFTVDDLNHLKRGGRINAATALFGTMLAIKPVMHVDDEGRLIPVSKARRPQGVSDRSGRPDGGHRHRPRRSDGVHQPR